MLRPITEYAVPLWHPGLTDGDKNKIEFLQKKALGSFLVVFILITKYTITLITILYHTNMHCKNLV